MEQVKIYRISLLPILVFMTLGILLDLISIFGLKKEDFSYIFLFIFILSIVSIGYSINLLKKRREGKGYYWDDEGILIDLKGNKVYWDKIDDIDIYKGKGGTNTVIYSQDNSKWYPITTNYISWFIIERPNEYHDNLKKFWKEKSKLKNIELR